MKEAVIVPGQARTSWGYLVVGISGAMLGGLVVAVATRALPKMASKMALGMMEGMAERMRESGCDPPKF